MRRAKRAARSLFFLGFARKKKPLHDGSCEACTCLFLFSVSMCIIQHRNRPLKSTALNAHGTDASADGLCARTHTLTKPSRAGFAVSRSELIEPGAATCVFRGMVGPYFKFQKLGLYVPGTNIP